jgi:hypothetical protein
MKVRAFLAMRRWTPLLLLGAVAVLAVGARCIENTSERVDRDGYTHILGEFFNETDVQATRVMVRGTLFDAAGNVVATKEAPICPPDSQPHSQSVFDIRFDNPNVPPHVRYEVRPASGVTLDAPLPNPNVLVLDTDAIGFEDFPFIPGFPITPEDVFFRFGARNRSQTVYTGLQACAAAYDNQGRVVAAAADELLEFDLDGNLVTATLPFDQRVDMFLFIDEVPPEAVYVRGWIWFGDPAVGTSAYQSIMTQPITIQGGSFFP